MSSLAVVIVSTNEAHWLRRCLPTVFAHAGGAELEVVVADNSSTDGTCELIRDEFPQARVIRCANKGFAHGNNRAYVTTTSPYVLFLNPDTEIVDGTFAELLGAMQRRPEVGLIGVRQLTGEGALHPTIRHFPTVRRMLMDAIGSERLPGRASRLGLRELDLDRYDRETACDWTSGSFMLARREAIEAAGLLDERFFIYSEETDLCLRIKRAGWQVVHLPTMTIIHHAGKAGHSERLSAQAAFAWRQYLAKNFPPLRRAAAMLVLAASYAARSSVSLNEPDDERRRTAARAALAALLGRRPPPFGPPASRAVAPFDPAVSQPG